MDRKKKLRFAQFFLLVLASLVIFFTYYKENTNLNNKIVNKENIKNVKKQLSNENPTNKNLFYNVEYSGLDLTGNRYVLKSEEAYSEIEDQSKVFMTNVNANFYFKDNWGRARPYQIEEFGGNLIYTPPLIKSDQCKKNCSWIGGETSAAFSFLAGLLFLRKKKKTLRILFLFGSLVIFCRMAMGGHFLSDNLFAVNLMIYISIFYII